MKCCGISEKDTVDWDPNFDESRKEPRVLPSRFPNLLVNGSSGIAVGMATNIPPHNLREVIGACIRVLDDPDATLADLMTYIKGPDFPTRGLIMGRSGIRAAYATGRGRVVMRARHEFEEFGHDRTRIIITELPYQVNKRMLIKSMADQVEDKRLEGISDIRDETDRNGMRIVIELKRDANPQVVLNRLFAQTQLQTTFAINMLALVNNQSQPKILSLRHIIDEYLAFQEEIIVRRTRYDLKDAQARAHLLEGLLIAQDNIDEVIHIIRTSYDNAKENLMSRFGLDDVQAQAILDMRLKALQGLDREKLQAEYKELEEKIAYFLKVLSDDALVRSILKEELSAIAEKYGDDRKTEIQDVEDEIDIEDLIEEEECVFTLTENGYIKRTAVSEYAAQSKGGMGKKGITTRDEDTVVDVFTASTHDYLLFFTDTGKVYRKKGYQIPESGKTARGTNIVNILQVEQGERIQTMLHYREAGEGQLYLFMTTRNGTVKRLPVETLKNLRNNGIRALTLDEGDELHQRAGDRRQPAHPHCHPRRSGGVLRRDGRACHGPHRRGRPGHPPAGGGLCGGRRPSRGRQDGTLHHGAWLRQAHPGGGVPHHQPWRSRHPQLHGHGKDRPHCGYQGGGRTGGSAADDAGGYPDPHGGGQHPHRRPGHAGRYRHAL